jgi:hypothetical protein
MDNCQTRKQKSEKLEKKVLLEKKGQGHRHGQLPGQETKEQLPEQEKIMSEAFRTVARI